MKDSYFLIESSLTRGAGEAHQLGDKVAYAHNWASTLFTNVSVRVSGQEISACNQYNHLAHTVKMRQMIDENRLSTQFRDMMDYDPDFTRRLFRHCKAGEIYTPDPTPANADVPTVINSQREDANVELANKYGKNIRSGDTTRYTIYQPVNLGVFDLGHGSGLCGDISILLNPNSNFESYAVESAKFGANGTLLDFIPAVQDTVDNAANHYNMQIHSITFMACYAKASKPIDSTMTFTLHEYQVMNKPWSDQLEFQVVPSCEQITAFIQDVAAGSSTIIPATSFKTRQYTQAEFTNQARDYGKAYTPDENGSIQVTLGAITKPPILLDPATNTPTKSGQLVRWLMSHQYLDGHKTVWERYNDWCSSPYYCFDFLRDSSDTSSYVTIRSKFTRSPGATVDWPGNVAPYLFCVSKYSRLVKIEYNSGYVTSIQIQNS